MTSRFMDALARGVLVGDGATGTRLQMLGFDKTPYDLACLLDPDLVLRVHQEYFAAGSDFVETNTFAASRIRLEHTNWDVRELNRRAAEIAREAAGPDKLVVGAIGPAGKALAPIGTLTHEQVYESVFEQAQALAEGGADAILLETYIDLDEIATAVRAVRDACPLPVIVSKAFIEDGEALSEGLPGICAARIAQMGVDALGANCVVGPQRMVDIVRQLSEATDLPVMAFPTPGLPQLVKGTVVYDTSPEYFGKACARLVEEGAAIVGGCCGTSPDHIHALRTVVEAGIRKKQARPATSAEPRAAKPLVQAEPTRLAERLAQRQFTIAVEMDLPRGLNVQKVLDGSKLLAERGAHLIDISDGARARLRMNPLSVSKIIQDSVDVEVMMHFACRDRNLLAVQADLLGAHALGVKNILAVTGDPANIGDYPSATSVYDVDSIGLVRILSRFNDGIDLAGNTVGMKCAFTIAIAFNPLAHDMVLELDRLARKVDAGAHVIYTQPIFEPEHIDRAIECAVRAGLPIFVGVLPLRSSRHAEFMHNEVPGIEVPERLRAKMAAAIDDEQAMNFGIEEAQALASKVRSQAQGLYLMPPFGNPTIAVRVMEAVNE
ncbi:MAG: bifunctional homocysteine S-methyltransferase/methylenetetrahydrofolate reductase [Chthonomonas sp.]|nr:bifunctional homocysteine S-methyltransferase/methylenetetrahydrofolate reductase [Chthonomonas sp.]